MYDAFSDDENTIRSRRSALPFVGKRGFVMKMENHSRPTGRLAWEAALITVAVFVGACTATMQLPDPLAAGWNGAPVCEELKNDPHHRILRCTLPPSVGHERHYHDRHFGYVVAGGTMKVTDSNGTREVDMATGSSYSNDGIDWHEVVNIGDTIAVFLIVEPK